MEKTNTNRFKTRNSPAKNKRTESFLFQNNETLFALINASPLAIIALDRSANTLIWNPAAERLFGWKEHEVVGRPYPLVPDSELADFTTLIKKEFLGQRHRAKEIKRLHKNGNMIDVNLWTAPMYDADGKMYAVLGMLSDNTENKRIKETLRQRDELLSAMGAMAKVGGWEFDIATGKGNWTEEVAKIHDMDPQDEINTEMGMSFYHGESRKKIELAVKEAVNHGEPYDLELEMITAKGTHKWVRTIARPVLKKGKVVKIKGSFQDITERKQTEQQQRLQSAALHASANAIMITDTKGTVEWINPAFTDLTGYESAEVIGKNPRQLVKSGKHNRDFYKKMWDSILSGNVWNGETFNRRKDGSFYIEDQTISPVRDKQGQVTHFISIKQDITQRKETEEAHKLFRALIDQTLDSIEIIDPETGYFLDTNDRGCKDLGYSREEFLTLSVLDIDPMVDQSVFKLNVEKLRKSGFLNLESKHRRKDGSDFPVEINLKYVRLERDYIVAIVRDVTERKLAEEKQKETLKRIQSQLRAISQVAGTELLLSGEVVQVAKEITELATRVLGAERANVWLFNDEETELNCIDLYEASQEKHSSGLLLNEQEYGPELEVLKKSKYVDASDPLTDPRTTGYVETYVKPLGISSMLDMVIHASDKNFGLLCVEHVNKPHQWEGDEIVFVRQLADKLAFTLISQQRKHVESELKKSELKFRSLVEESLTGVYIIQDEKFVYVNPEFEKIFGYTHTEFLDLSSIYELVDEEHRQTVAENIHRRIVNEVTSLRYTFNGRHKDGNLIYVEVLGARTEWNGKPAILGTLLNITDRRLAEEKIHRLNRLYKVTSNINTLIVHVNNREELFDKACQIAVKEGKFFMVWIGMLSPDKKFLEHKSLAGFEEDYLHKIRPSLRVDDDSEEDNSICVRAFRNKKNIICNNIEQDAVNYLWQKDASERGYKSMMALPLVVEGEVTGVIGFYASEPGFFDEQEVTLLNELTGDISFALFTIAQQEKLEFLASYDPLTGLSNRSLFNDHLSFILDSARRFQNMVALLVFNLKQFRHINNAFGRNIGDSVLQEVANRLKALSANPANVGHITGDYFAMVMPGERHSTNIIRKYEESIIPALNKPYVITGNQIQVDFVTGIAIFPADGDDAEILYSNAEAALKKAKKFNSRYLFYQPEMTASIAETLLLENKLKLALKKNQFVLYYQPKVDAINHKICGLEALIRWNDPETGLVPPGKFIPILEESGMILDVGKWAMNKAMEDAEIWKSHKVEPPHIAVNVSALQLQEQDFVETVTEIVSQIGGEDCLLDLEVTESLFMINIEDNIKKLAAIKNLGVSISIDDFGTGYSSLGYLSKLPVNALKIDRSFIITMDQKPESMTIVSTIINLGHSFNLKVIAEGVETEEQSKLLRLLKCDEMQGYLFSKPLPPEDILNFLQKARKL